MGPGVGTLWAPEIGTMGVGTPWAPEKGTEA